VPLTQVSGQQVQCSRFITRSKQFLKEEIYRSDTLTLPLAGGLKGVLEINNAGDVGAVHFDFVFKRRTTGFIDINNLLIIHFTDHSKAEIFARTRHQQVGKVSFALLRLTEQRLGTNLTSEDQLFLRKLVTTPISYLELRIDGEKKEMKLSASDAGWIQNVITCLETL